MTTRDNARLHNQQTHHDILTPTHAEWARTWEPLPNLVGNYADHNPLSEEYWEYTVTFCKDRPAIRALLPLHVLVHEFRHRDRSDACRPSPCVARGGGNVVLHLTTSTEYSGGWNRPFSEGTPV